MISECISLCRELIDDETVTYRVSDTRMKEWFRRACFDAQKILGFPALERIEYNFNPYILSDPTKINPAMYENYSNITINQYLYLTDPTNQGYIETKSVDEIDRLAMVKITANCKDGSVDDDVIFDISLDKPNDLMNGNSGTWLVADGLLTAIENGVYCLVDTLVSKKFAIKITILSGKTIKLVDLSIERFRLSANFKDGDIIDIAKLMASYDFEDRAGKAVNAGNSKETVDWLFWKAREFKKQVLNQVDDKQIIAGVGGSINLHPGNPYADKALSMNNEIVSGFGNNSIVEIITDGTIRRTN
jgi:hypothetical protein